MNEQTTELAFVYSLLNVVRNAEHNNDESVTESLMRNFVRIHRSEIMRKYYKGGIQANDEVFQIKSLTFTKINDTEFTTVIPKIIKLDNDYGFYVDKYGVSFSISNSMEYQSNKKDFFGRNLIDLKAEGQKLTLRLPNSLSELDSASENYNIIKSYLDSIYLQELNNFNENQNNPITITADLHAVLFDPSDADNYDWEIDVFPFPAEALPELERQILVREFGIMNSAKRDEVQNARGDEIRYHDNEQVQNS